MISFKQFLQRKDYVKVCVCTADIPFSVYGEMFEASNFICLLNADDEKKKNFRKCFPRHARLIIQESFTGISEVQKHFKEKGYLKISIVSNERLPECVHFDMKLPPVETFAQFANQINNTKIALKLWKTREKI